ATPGTAPSAPMATLARRTAALTARTTREPTASPRRLTQSLLSWSPRTSMAATLALACILQMVALSTSSSTSLGMSSPLTWTPP
ncbi:hypothetical protein BN1708_020304, partial [Verticillium longisporum]